jgi:hypothetical protein
MNTPKANSLKKRYMPPEIEIYQYVVEKGFTQSPDGTTRFESFSEINDAQNENERGQWDVSWS